LAVEAVSDRGFGLVLPCGMPAEEAACPRCGQPSRRVHSRYHRRLDDAPIAGRAVRLRVRVRRLFCDNSSCRSQTFAEQPAGLPEPRARRTSLVTRLDNFEGARIWTGHGILAHNLVKIAALTACSIAERRSTRSASQLGSS
jgi:transposase